MSAGPRIPKSAKLKINEISLACWDKSPEELLDPIKKAIGRLVGRMPVDRTILNYISSARQGEPSPFDKAWGLGIPIEYGIPIEANNDLLNIRRWGIAVDRTFTIREAKWAARLRGTVPPSQLLKEAFTYATRERACELLRMKKVYTDDLDAELALRINDWSATAIHFMAKEMGILARPAKKEIIEALKKGIIPVEEELTLKSLPQELAARFITDDLDSSWLTYPAGKAVEYRLGLKCRHGTELVEGADILYALCLRRLTKGSRWEDMSVEAKGKVAECLHDEVVDWLRKSPEQYADESLFWFKRRILSLLFSPSKELFKQVGLEEGAEKQGGKP